MKKECIYFLVISLWAIPLSAQECFNDDYYEAFVDCILPGLEECVALHPPCAMTDAYRGFGNMDVLSNVENKCCGKSSKKKIFKCYKKYQRIFKKAKRLYSSLSRAQLKEEFTIKINFIKQNGRCEQEGEDD